MLVIALALLLNAASVCEKVCDPDPMCQAVCGTPDRKLQQQICEARLMHTAQELDELQFITGQCMARLAKCEAKPACPLKKPTKKIVKKPAKIVKTTVPVIVKQEQKQEQSQQVVVNVIVKQDRQEDRQDKPFPLGVGVRGAVGLTCNPMIFGLVGVRGRILPAHLGLEVNTQFAYGHSAQLMVYPIQGPIAWHLDFGGLMYLNDGPKFNLLAGTGVEVGIVPHLSITADWRMTMAKPFYLGDSLLKYQLMLGLMLHTW